MAYPWDEEPTPPPLPEPMWLPPPPQVPESGFLTPDIGTPEMPNIMPAFEAPPQHPAYDPNFLERLGLAFQNLQMNPSAMTPGGALIAGLMQGYGASKGGQAQRAIAGREQENQRLTESARNMANQRWRQANLAIQQARLKADDLRRQEAAELQRRRDDAAQGRFDATLAETKRHNRATENRDATVTSEDPNIVSLALKVWRGEMTMGEVPAGKNGQIRGSVAKYLEDNALEVTPQKVREARSQKEFGFGLINEFRLMSEKVNRSEQDALGVGRRVQGLQNWWQVFSQSGDPAISNYPNVRSGLSSWISRLYGQVGVLTDRDVKIAMDMIPDMSDTGANALDKISRLERFLNSKFEAFEKAYMTPGGKPTTPAGGSGSPASTAPPDMVFVRDANGKLVRVK